MLWTRPPHTDDDSSWVRHCLALTGAPDSYTENGLQALLRLWMFRADYRRVIQLLAERIVGVSPAEPAMPNEPPGPDAMDEPAAPASFAVIVAADPGWRPFSGEASLPVARYAARVAERLDFIVTVTTLEEAGELNSMPALVLIDGRDPGKPVDHLPPGAIPITIGGDPEPGLANARTFDDFGRLLPFLIADAQRQFVRHGTS